MGIWPPEGRFVNVVWQVSDVCNYRCSYCNPGNWGGAHPNREAEKYIGVLEKILDHYLDRGCRSFKFFFSGGEPTVWPPLVPVIEFIRSKVERPLIAVNTNMSRPLAWWKEHSHLFQDIVASFHVESANRERYLECVEYLQYRVGYLACRLLMHDERFQEVADFADVLRAHLKNCVLEYAPLFAHLSPHSEMHHYQEAWKREYLEKYQYERKSEAPFCLLDAARPAYCMELTSDGQQHGLNSNRLVAEGRNHFSGWKCWIDDSIFITPNGDIRTASCSQGAIIGNINEGRVRLGGDPVTCRAARCNCGTDINIPKLHPDWLEKVERIRG